MDKNMDDIYSRYTENIHHIRVKSGTYEVDKETLERVMWALMWLEENVGLEEEPLLLLLLDRLKRAFFGVGDVEPLPTVRAPEFHFED